MRRARASLARHFLGVGRDEGDLEGVARVGGDPALRRRIVHGEDVDPPIAGPTVRLHELSPARLDHARHHLGSGGGMRGGLGGGNGEDVAVTVEEANAVDGLLPRGEVVQEVDQLGLWTPAYGERALHRDLDRPHHALGARLLVLHPCPRLLLHAQHAVDADHEQERQHEQQDQAGPQCHGLGADDNAAARERAIEVRQGCDERGGRLGADKLSWPRQAVMSLDRVVLARRWQQSRIAALTVPSSHGGGWPPGCTGEPIVPTTTPRSRGGNA
jgi:hypothetical protein